MMVGMGVKNREGGGGGGGEQKIRSRKWEMGG